MDYKVLSINMGTKMHTENIKDSCKESKDPVLFHPIPLLEIFLFFEIWHFLIKSSDFGDWTHQG